MFAYTPLHRHWHTYAHGMDANASYSHPTFPLVKGYSSKLGRTLNSLNLNESNKHRRQQFIPTSKPISISPLKANKPRCPSMILWITKANQILSCMCSQCKNGRGDRLSWDSACSIYCTWDGCVTGWFQQFLWQQRACSWEDCRHINAIFMRTYFLKKEVGKWADMNDKNNQVYSHFCATKLSEYI